MGLLREVRAAKKPGCPVCGPRGDAYNQGRFLNWAKCWVPSHSHLSRHLLLVDAQHKLFQARSARRLLKACVDAECHCKAGHVDKSKVSSKRHSDTMMDSAPDSPNSGSDASWAMEPKEKKHKFRFARLFQRKPKSHAAGSDAASVASSLASESSRFQVSQIAAAAHSRRWSTGIYCPFLLQRPP